MSLHEDTHTHTDTHKDTLTERVMAFTEASVAIKANNTQLAPRGPSLSGSPPFTR